MTVVADLLRRHRLAAGLTQEELAGRAGVAVRTVRNLELGSVSRPRRHTLQQLADELRLTGPERTRLLDTRQGVAPGAFEPLAGPSVVSLPPGLPDFTGREEPLRQITARATGAGTPWVVIAGPPGIGKTSLAVRAAHRLAPAFPAGVFFVSLRGMDDEPTSTTDALSQVLAALGVARMPEAADERMAAYRALTGSGRGLLVLDNARDEAHVRPLLPAGAGWVTLITSRSPLGGLSAAERIVLGVLSAQESYGLLARAVGADRINLEPAAATELARLCGGLPLALRVAANRLAVRPEWSVQSLAERLRDEQHRLDQLHVGDLGVRSAFELSYRLLDAPARRTLRLLSVAPLPLWPIPLVAALTGVDEVTAERHLDTLVDAGLLDPAQATGQFARHDLLALFAAGRSAAEDDPAERLAAQDRLAGHLLGRCTAAGAWLEPEPSRPDGVFPDAPAALAWLDGSKGALWWAVRHAAAQGRYREVLTAARDLYWYSDRRHGALPWSEFFHLAVHAARALGDVAAESRQENNLGWALRLVEDRPAQAYPHHVTALRLARAAGDRTSEGWALRYLGAVLALRGDLDGAMEQLARARDIFAELGDRLAGVVVARARAELLRSRGDLAAAHDVLTAALAGWNDLAGRLSGLSVRGYLRTQLGLVQVGLGEPGRALETLEAALADFAAGDDAGDSGTVHLTLARLALDNPDPAALSAAGALSTPAATSDPAATSALRAAPVPEATSALGAAPVPAVTSALGAARVPGAMHAPGAPPGPDMASGPGEPHTSESAPHLGTGSFPAPALASGIAAGNVSEFRAVASDAESKRGVAAEHLDRAAAFFSAAGYHAGLLEVQRLRDSLPSAASTS
ncbi:ATP-binding protein [Actinoplanes sp. RD1]|uniref:ATP-binding protein n=1 Tax=Actinoplanes sp. RD1 TaxID=3064538 RepID=UPI002741138E|nr:NB-ARC domain-containing protein [Actinoplanes sp. RD1]